jgi:glycosyltransferase involved in cell wall biosynthesis
VRTRIRVFDPVPNDQLLARTMSHDVGLALEVPHCTSRDLTATNKIFEYMRAGLGIIATATRGQEEVMSASPGAGTLIPPGDPTALAEAMQRMVDDTDHRKGCRRASAAAGMGVWSWERYEPILLRAMADGLAEP